MKRCLSVAGAILLAALSAAAQTHPNFSGTWTLDAANSDFGPMPGPESIVMVIDHKDPTLKVAVTQKSPMGETSNESTYTTDGKNNVNRLRLPAGDQDVTSTTTWKGQTLATSRTIEAQGMSIGIDDTWELSADGKVLTVAQQLNTPQGSFNTKVALNKK